MTLMIKNELIDLLKNKETVISTVEISKIGEFFLVFADETMQQSFKHFISFVPNNITIDGRYNHNQKIKVDDD